MLMRLNVKKTTRILVASAVLVVGGSAVGVREAGAGQAPVAPTPQALPLAMEQAVAMALEANLGLKAERLNVDVANQSILLAHATFLPQVQSSVSRQSSRSVPSDFTQRS